jgi:hypothetical protein
LAEHAASVGELARTAMTIAGSLGRTPLNKEESE